MKKISIILFAVLAGLTGYSQSEATSIEFNKTMKPTLRLELASSQSDVEATILEKLKQAGYKPETTGAFFWKNNQIDGFYVFKNILLPKVSAKALDMYFKVSPKNAEEKNNSTLYMLVSTGNENFASPQRDTTLWGSSTRFLNGFVSNTIAYSLEQSIGKQEEMLTAAQKKLNSLQSDEKDLNEKLRKTQEELQANQRSQADQQVELDQQKKSLETLKAQRKA